ncbi:hypothetical protein D9619_007898 [Psilocybe cf. subviscida]|uniref:NADH dehydrogenase [ubiquinone] iron-sulfur protein 5 n=1 Tax=Psilocybe cf. subviscida TaxID=2480587 RepID=A0A8H5ATP5_9AGAR|nr:hypothetical protein D9619_007898 [Psilocybe cf. subviscida]
MASGFGWGGGRSKCFTQWQQFQKCYAQTDSPRECAPLSEDYLECLHGLKAMERATTVQAEYARQLEAQGKTIPRDSGGFVDLNLLKQDKDKGEEKKGH